MIAIGTNSEPLQRTLVETPLGRFALATSAKGLCSLVPLGPGAGPDRAQATGEGRGVGRFASPATPPRHLSAAQQPTPRSSPAAEQERSVRDAAAALLAYCAGDPSPYGGALDLAGTEFQLRVWRRLLAIPFGAQVTYGALAAELGVAGEARAVGTAVAANPIAILVPCHRVVGAGGTLRGYAWGLDLKRRLLARELRLGPAFQPAGGRDTGRT